MLKFSMRAQFLDMVGLIIQRPMAWIVSRLLLGISALLCPYKCKNIIRGTFPDAYVRAEDLQGSR